MEDLQSGCKYFASTEDKNSKSVIFVKLTDSALQSIETFLNTKDGSSSTPTIQIQDNSGVISLPSQGKLHNYGFTLSNIEGVKGGFQCFHHIENSCLESLGFIKEKLQIQAKDDSYENTKIKLTAVDQEQKNLGAKVLELDRLNLVRLNLDRLELSEREKHSGMVYVPELPTQNPTNPDSNLKARTTSGPLLHQPIRERIIQILAAKEYKKAELLLRLKREGISDKDKSRINVILEEVAHLKGTTLMLDDYVWDAVQEDWEFYSNEESQIVKKKKQQYLKTKGTADPTTSSAKQKNGSSSAREIYTKICNQKMNTVYNVAQNGNTDQNESTNNIASTSGSATLASTSSSATFASTSSSATPEKSSFHFNGLNGTFKTSNKKKRGRPRIKKEVNGISQAQKCVIPNLPSLQASFVSEELRDEGICIKSEENTRSEANVEGALSKVNKVKKTRKRNIVPKTESNTSRTCDSDYIAQKLKEYKQILLNYSSPRNHSITPNHTNNSGNVSETVPVAQAIPEYDFSEVTRKYTKVKSSQQRQQYHDDFSREYADYLNLLLEMKEISDKFSELGDHLQEFEEGSPEYRKIKLEIGQEFKRRHTPSYISSRKKFDFFKDKLAHIKQLIEEYDRETTSEV